MKRESSSSVWARWPMTGYTTMYLGCGNISERQTERQRPRQRRFQRARKRCQRRLPRKEGTRSYGKCKNGVAFECCLRGRMQDWLAPWLDNKARCRLPQINRGSRDLTEGASRVESAGQETRCERKANTRGAEAQRRKDKAAMALCRSFWLQTATPTCPSFLNDVIYSASSRRISAASRALQRAASAQPALRRESTQSADSRPLPCPAHVVVPENPQPCLATLAWHLKTPPLECLVRAKPASKPRLLQRGAG